MANNKCFVVSPIGEEGGDVRRRADLIYKHVIQDAIQDEGYDVLRADRIAEGGIITTQVVNHLVDDDLVVADLTGHNPNVFYELAIRHCTHKPYIQLINKGDEIPFDVAIARTILVDHTDLDSVAKAKGEIRAQVQALKEGEHVVESPVSLALVLQQMRESGNPSLQVLAEVRELVANMKTDIESAREQFLLSGALVSTSQIGSIAEAIGKTMLSESAMGDGMAARIHKLREMEADLRTGDNFLADGRPREAEVMYDNVRLIEPDDPSALIGKAKALKRRSANEQNPSLISEAIRVLDRLLGVDPTNARAYYNRACYKALSTQSGEKEFDRAEILSDLTSAIIGFEYYREMAKSDKDLESLWGDSDFQNLVENPG